MQKGKHQGGQTQGYPPRSYSAYPGNPENSRQYSRGEVPAFHTSGTPGGGPGMRGMHHAPPTQPPTPPTSQDIKQPPAHLPPQAHQMPPQSGGQMMQYAMPGAGRGSTQQTPFFTSPRAPPGGQRMAPHGRPSVVMSNSAPSFMTQPVVQPVYQGHVLSTQMSGQQPVFVSPPMSQPFQLQQPRHQSGAFYSSQPAHILVQQHAMFSPYHQPGMYYGPSIQPMSRAGGPAQSTQGTAPAQPQPSLTLIASHGGSIIPNAGVSRQVKTTREKKILTIIDPKDGRNIMKELNDNDNASRSGESSARQTPQPNAGQKPDQGVAAEFATRVAIAARGDNSGSPNSPALQQSSSRTSNYSESESQASPDPQGMSTPSVSPSKLDTSVESISSESQIVENNIPYDANQSATMLRAWPPVRQSGSMPVEILTMSIHPGMMITDDMMRAGPLPSQPTREYPAVQPQWIAEGNPVQGPVFINKEPTAQIESSVRSGPGVPVVSALTQGPTVDIGPRPPKEQFPALGKGHQQQSPVKRKQRSEPTQEQGEGKVKDQQSKVASQPKPKSITPNVENQRKQTPTPTPTPGPPSQESDEYVQSVQTKINEPKTIIIKKNDSDSSAAKTKSNDSSKNKESNNVVEVVRNLNEDTVQDNNNRNKSENVKCEVPVAKESSPVPASDEPVEKPVVLEEAQPENVPSVSVPEPEVVSASLDESAPSKTNGEAVEEEAKSNNQKSKAGNKRPAQSKMRLESKESRNVAEPETPSIEVTPSVAPAPESKNSSAAPTAVNNEQIEKAQEEAVVDEDKEKEKEDLIVATKNEENSKQTTSTKANDTAHAPAAPNKVVLKHTYEVDQWSPLNPEGKKKYDRQFIMGLQNDPQSMRKPKNFPNLELLSDSNKQRHFDRNAINSMSRSHVDVMYPFFANKNSSQRSGQAITKRGSQQGKPKAAKPAVVQVSLQQDVKLHETENAWKPTRHIEPVNRTEEEAKTESLYKRVRGILNKLTPEKFDKLVSQVNDLPIDNPTRLEGVIDLVFKKAVDEPSFSVAYALMCKTLQKMEVPSDQVRPDGKPEGEKNFRKLLINRCQQEFERNTAAELKRDERLQEIEMEKDPEKKKALQLAFEEEERRIRMRSVGNIRFIGELYKLQMLTCKIMYSCITQLLNQGDEESLECLCKLLTTIGQGLESKEKATKASSEKVRLDDNKIHDLNSCFKELNDIVKNKGSGKVSSRVRFMIQDLIDLRSNRWIPRRNESQPKTIDQIQKEAERENMEMNLALNSPQERNKRQDMRNSMDNRKRGLQDSSGWTLIQSSQPNKSSRYVIESSKLKLDQSDVEVASSLSLGNRSQFLWGQGAGSGKMDDKRSMSQLGSNKFAVLSLSLGPNMKGNSDKDRLNSYKPVDDDLRPSSKSGSHHENSRSSSRESASSKRDDSKFISTPNKASVPPVQPPAPANDALDRHQDSEEISKKTKLLLEEYLSCLDVNEGAKYLNELFSPSSLKAFVANILGEVMEKKGSSPKRAVGLLMNHFINQKYVSKEQFLVGLSEVLETADDLTIDMPLVWEYLAEILVDMVAEEVITFKDIVSAITPIKGSPGSAKFLAALMKILKSVKDVAWIEKCWDQSQVSLKDIINQKDIKDFVRQNNVEFMSRKFVKDELSRMIATRASFDEITAWVTENVCDAENVQPSFLKVLMTVLLEAVVTKNQSSSYKLDIELLSYYEPLILRYTNHKEELELPCLFAIQAFVHKLEYPQAILHNIFNHLWDGDLIAAESFKAWRDSNNPQEQEGHAVCVTSLKSFFTHLNETETDDES